MKYLDLKRLQGLDEKAMQIISLASSVYPFRSYFKSKCYSAYLHRDLGMVERFFRRSRVNLANYWLLWEGSGKFFFFFLKVQAS